jgi:hypothetical protein
MEVEEVLLGFDARRAVGGNSADWDADRRENFLIRTDATRPLSTDQIVWPPVFEGDPRPASCAGHQTLWNDLECLRLHAPSSDQESSEPYCLVAVTVHPGDGDEGERDYWRSQAPPSTPPARDAAWSLLGYDVSDRWLLSGLSNCGFLPAAEDVQAIRRRWSGKLNKHHLFDAPADAFDFRELADKRAEEHSPFFVFGIWLL